MRLRHNRVGLRVVVHLLDNTITAGVIVARKRHRPHRYKVVSIRLDDGRTVRGWECWWGAAKPDPVGRWALR